MIWIGIFCFTARSALSMSFEDENPDQVRLLCQMGIIYAFMIDRAVFMYEFNQGQTILGAVTISTMVLSYLSQVLKKMDWGLWIPFRAKQDSDLDKVEGP